MFEETLTERAKDKLALLGQSGILQNAYLAGGTADIADIRDIAAMKIDAVATRGTKRDFIDLYFICQSGYRLVELLDFYNKKYQNLASNLVHIQKSLVFFDDAEPDEMPRMLKEVVWEEVKEFFENEVRDVALAQCFRKEMSGK